MSKIKVVAVDFRGILILEEFLKMTSPDVDSVVISMHHSEFEHSSAKIKIETGKDELFRLDGGSPQRSARLAEKWRDEIFTALDGAEIVLGIADLGDDDGEGIPPVIADIAKKTGALTIFIAIMPVQNWMVPFRRIVMRIDDEYFFKTMLPKTPTSKVLKIIDRAVVQDVKNILDCYVSRSFALST